MAAKTKQGNPEARRPGEDEQASQYARSLIEASLDPLVTISPEGKTQPALSGHGKARISILLLSVLGILALIGGYYWFSQKPTVPLEKVIIAAATQPIAGPVYVAFTEGYFRDEGLDVTLQPYTSGKAALNAVLEGKANLSTSAETPIMFAGLRAEKIYLIATIHHADKNTALVARKDKGISRPIDLKGKKIGVTLGTNGEFFMDTFMLVHGILRSKKEVEVVNLKPEEMFEALVKGEVDAVSTWNPHVIRLQKELGAKGITFYGEGIYTETFNISAARDFVHKNPEAVEKVLRSLVRAVDFIRENPDKARRVISNYIRMDEAMIGELWGIYHFGVTLDQSLLITLEDQARWAIKNKLTDKTEVPNYLNFIYQDGLKAVKPETVTIIR